MYPIVNVPPGDLIAIQRDGEGCVTGLFFKNDRAIDRFIENLHEAKEQSMRDKQREYDEKHQLSLNFN